MTTFGCKIILTNLSLSLKNCCPEEAELSFRYSSMKRIMLYEPDVSIFEVMSLVFLETKFIIKPFPYSDIEPSSKITSFKPDLVILDLFQDYQRPLALTKLIRSLLPSTGLIVSSCNPDISQIFKKLGFDAYISKPFDIDHLINLVNCYLKPSFKY